MPMHESSCIEDPSFFRSFSSLLSVSVVVAWLFSLFRCTHTVWLKFESSFIPWSTWWFMHAVSVASVLSIIIISLMTLLVLLSHTFNLHDVVEKYPAYFRWGPWHPGRERASHRLWAQRPPHYRGSCRIHPGVLERAAVPWWLLLRWGHHRSDAPWCVPKTSRSLWRRRPVVLSVVVSQSWQNRETRCFPTCVERPRNSE